MKDSTLERLSLWNLEGQKYFSLGDGDVVIFDDISLLPDERARQTDVIIHIICTQGRMQLTYNSRTYELNSGEVFIVQPNSVVSDFLVSTDLRCTVLCVRPEPYASLLYVSKRIWNDVSHVRHNPVFPLTDSDLQRLYRYFELIAEKAGQSEEPFYEAIARSLVSAVVLELVAIYERHARKVDTPDDEGHYSQSDLLVKRFLELVHQHAGRIRSVSEYAGMLNVTPKYLSSLVKLSSGSNAHDLISQATVQAIETRLRYSELSVKEIAADLDFPSLSFFGRFVKEHLGASPNEYRKRIKKQ